jgi:hypothetical protein
MTISSYPRSSGYLPCLEISEISARPYSLRAARRAGLAQCGSLGPHPQWQQARSFLAGLSGRSIESEDHCILYCVPAAVRGPDPTGCTSNRGDVCGFSTACRLGRLMLGDRLGVGASLVHETCASQVTRGRVRTHHDWRWDVAVAVASARLNGDNVYRAGVSASGTSLGRQVSGHHRRAALEFVLHMLDRELHF